MPGEREYAKLQRKLDELYAVGTLRFYEISDSASALRPRGFQGPMELIPIARDTASKRRIFRDAIAKLRDDIPPDVFRSAAERPEERAVIGPGAGAG